MSKVVYIIEGAVYYGEQREVLAVCDTAEAAKRGVIYYKMKEYNNVNYFIKEIDDFKNIENDKIFYLYHIVCHVNKNYTLKGIDHCFLSYTYDKKEAISWSKGKQDDGTNFFTIVLKLCLKNELPSILSKENRKMIKDKIYELSEGEIKVTVPFANVDD